MTFALASDLFSEALIHRFRSLLNLNGSAAIFAFDLDRTATHGGRGGSSSVAVVSLLKAVGLLDT